MYLISVYFDKKTENRIQSYINDVAIASGNSFMIDNEVPPHMTITAFETLHEENVVEVMNHAMLNIKKNTYKRNRNYEKNSYQRNLRR